VKKTIAIIGAGVEIGAAIVDKLSAGNYRLLLVSNEINELSQIVQNIKQNNLNPEVETVDCAKEGCWEADIIVLAIPYHTLKKVIEKINEVATQKIVLFISNNEDEIKPWELQRLLPYSRVVAAFCNPYTFETFITSDDKEASETISKMISTAITTQQ